MLAYSLLSTVITENEVSDLLKLEIEGMKAGILFDQTMKLLLNFPFKKSSSANIILS